mgnify:CR=1 FL=1
MAKKSDQLKEKRTTKKLFEKQPEVNIGLVGHVDHGKTTLTERLSGKWTDTHSEELKRGITIRLGYANSTLRKCPKCNPPANHTAQDKCEICGNETDILRRISLVDAPGHETLMATLISGTNIMDGALLLVAANEECPQPQTREHLMALQIAGIKKVIVVQNKIDLVSKEQALKNYKQIRNFLDETEFKETPIIPISARQNLNVGFLIKTIEEVIKTPERDTSKAPVFQIARSFDINKPGATPDELQGGVLGGAITQGVLKKGDEIEIVPGYKSEKSKQTVWTSIKTKITGLMTGSESIPEAGPGGSVAMQTQLDPSLVKSDTLAGNIVGLVNHTPPVWYDLSLKPHLLERVVGTKEELKVDPIAKNEVLMLNINSTATVGVVSEVSKKEFKCKLKLPIAAYHGTRATIFRRIG